MAAHATSSAHSFGSMKEKRNDFFSPEDNLAGQSKGFLASGLDR